MAQITVNVNGKQYPLACRDGEEDRLRDLANYVDSKAQDLTGKLGKVSESRLLLMISIMIADEMQEMLEKGGHSGPLTGMSEDDVAGILEQVALDVDRIADDLARP